MKKFEVRSSDINADENKLTGYAVVWDSPSQILYDEFTETFQKGAFSESLRSGNDVRVLFEHDNKNLLGRTSSGTLKIAEDDHGLRFELTPPATQLGRDVMEMISRRDITGMSFGFIPTKEDWDVTKRPYKRSISKADLIEITITATPAYQASNVELARRSLLAAHPELEHSPDYRVFWIDSI